MFNIICLKGVAVPQPMRIAEVLPLPPNRTYYCIFAAIRARNLPSNILALFTKLLTDHSIQVVRLTAYQQAENLEIHCLADFTESKAIPESLIRELQAKFKENLVAASWEEIPKTGSLHNSLAHPYTINFLGKEEEIAAFTLTAWKTLFEELWHKFGTGGLAILWHIGNAMGKSVGQQIKKTHPNLTPQQLIEAGLARLQALGWTNIKIAEIDLNKPYITLRATHSLEAEATKTIPNFPSTLIKGLLQGFITTILNKPCKVENTKNTARGDPYNEYIVEPETPT